MTHDSIKLMYNKLLLRGYVELSDASRVKLEFHSNNFANNVPSFINVSFDPLTKLTTRDRYPLIE